MDIEASRFTAVLDACVLYPAPLRDLLMETAATGLFRAKWTAAIQREWIDAVVCDRPELAEPLKRTVALMAVAAPDALVTGFENLIDGLSLPDPDDRHVLAAAIKCNAAVIVTSNLKDFPLDALAEFGVEPLHPDDFMLNQIGLDAAKCLAAVQRCRRRLRSPAMTSDEYLAMLLRQGLPATVAALRDFAAIL